jgi:hypothetical protein
MSKAADDNGSRRIMSLREEMGSGLKILCSFEVCPTHPEAPKQGLFQLVQFPLGPPSIMLGGDLEPKPYRPVCRQVIAGPRFEPPTRGRTLKGIQSRVRFPGTA